MKLCIDCANYHKRTLAEKIMAFDAEEHWCNATDGRPVFIDPVTGARSQSKRMTECKLLREFSIFCGGEAEWFKPIGGGSK